MKKPELIFIAGCNAAGKSIFVRARLSEVSRFEIIMTDAYKGRTTDLLQNILN